MRPALRAASPRWTRSHRPAAASLGWEATGLRFRTTGDKRSRGGWLGQWARGVHPVRVTERNLPEGALRPRDLPSWIREPATQVPRFAREGFRSDTIVWPPR